MLKKTIEYLDLDGNKVRDVFYFNLSKAELAEMELRSNGTFAQNLMKIVADKNGDAIIDTFQDLIRRSYGVRGEDGKRFIKNEQVWQEFIETDAYSELFMELVTNAQAGADFIHGVIPAEMAQKAVENRGQIQVDLPKSDEVVPAFKMPTEGMITTSGAQVTRSELASMSTDEVVAFLQKNGTIKD